MRRAGRGSTGKRERAVYIRDCTRDALREAVRRAKLLNHCAGRTTTDDVLTAALRLLLRTQAHDAERSGITLAPPRAPDETARAADRAVRPPSY